MYYILKIVARMLVFLTTRCRIEGKENVPYEGPLLVVANHLSVSDPVVIGGYLGRKVVFMAKEELFRHRLTGYFIRNFGAFPVSRGRYNRDALRQSDKVLKKGLALGMFPEGKRSTQGVMMPALSGTAMVAYHNHVQILPIGIDGTEKIRGLSWILKRPRVIINIGTPFYLPQIETGLDKEQLAEYTDIIMQHIAELLPENLK